MDFGTILSGFSILCTLALGVGVFINSRRQNQTMEKKLTIEEQTAEDDREDVIAERRRIELERLYERVARMESDMNAMRERLSLHETQSIEMIHHIVRLENGYPVPPGPPPRPMWRLPLLMQDQHDYQEQRERQRPETN